MKITFLGGAQSVTGSNYMLEVGGLKIMIDCGLFQGSKEAEMFNYEKFNFDPSEIDAVFLTHSHADHTGRLPKLYKEGFRGVIYGTPPTLDITRVALPDNLSLLSSEAEREGREPLFTEEDVVGALGLSYAKEYGEEISLSDSVKATFHNAGHILGSAFVEIASEGKKIFFSGDLGNPNNPLLKGSEYPIDADYILVESAYGSRVHEAEAERNATFINTIEDTVRRGGTIIMPSFALERTQDLLFDLNNLINEGKLPNLPIYLDSPLATKITGVFKQYPEYFNDKVRHIFESDSDIFNFPNLHITQTSQESKNINNVQGPKMIIAGSGMSTGGRVLHHERRYLSDPNSVILFVGYQAQGTLGRKILDGASEVTIFGEKVPVRCNKVAIGGFSAHADQPTLLSWIAKGAEGGHLKKVFVVQGEAESATVLRDLIRSKFSVASEAPVFGDSFEL